jgi:hypothetical protein
MEEEKQLAPFRQLKGQEKKSLWLCLLCLVLLSRLLHHHAQPQSSSMLLTRELLQINPKQPL